MTDNIKLPPYPEGLCLREDIEDYAREAVRLNAQAVPDTREIFNAGWCAAARFCDREDAVYDGLVGPGGCPAFEEAYRAALSAAPAAPQPAAQQGEIAWPAIPATVRRDVTMLAGYAEGSKSAEIVNTVRRVINWLNADRIAAQAQDAAPAAQGEPLVWKQDASYLDVVQQRMTWSGIPVLVTGRVVTHHGNWPLIDAARAAQQKGVKND